MRDESRDPKKDVDCDTRVLDEGGTAWCLLKNHPGSGENRRRLRYGVGDESGCPEPPDSADAMVTAEVRGRRRETSVADNPPVEAEVTSRMVYDVTSDHPD